MTAILEMIHSVEYSFEDIMRQLVSEHPYIASILFLIGTPIFIVLAVAICATAIMLPIGVLFGWL